MRLIEMATSSVVFAVHPNYIIDAASAASSKWADSPEKYGPHRMKILKNYINRFKRFLDGKVNAGSMIVITTMGEPYSLHNWHDEKSHWEKADAIKMGMEQEEVYQLYKDLMDYIYQLASEPNVYVVPEESAGDACKLGRLDHVLDRADEVLIIGGNLSGCLRHTIKTISKRPNGPSIRVMRELTFDDDPEFWGRLL